MANKYPYTQPLVLKKVNSASGQKVVEPNLVHAGYSYDLIKQSLTIYLDDKEKRDKALTLTYDKDCTAKSLSRDVAFKVQFTKGESILVDNQPLQRDFADKPINDGVEFSARSKDGRTRIVGWLTPHKEGRLRVAVGYIRKPSPKEQKENVVGYVDLPGDTQDCVDAVVIVVPPP
jgi:hypothetical protein